MILILLLQGVARFGRAPVRSKFTFKEPAQDEAKSVTELRTADIFGRGASGNVLMAGAMLALGFVLPKKAQKGMTYAFFLRRGAARHRRWR